MKVWYKTIAYLKDEKNFDEALGILAARVGNTPDQYEGFYNGTKILSLAEAKAAWKPKDSVRSTVLRPSSTSSTSTTKSTKSLDVKTYLDPSFTAAITE